MKTPPPRARGGLEHAFSDALHAIAGAAASFANTVASAVTDFVDRLIAG